MSDLGEIDEPGLLEWLEEAKFLYGQSTTTTDPFHSDTANVLADAIARATVPGQDSAALPLAPSATYPDGTPYGLASPRAPGVDGLNVIELALQQAKGKYNADPSSYRWIFAETIGECKAGQDVPSTFTKAVLGKKGTATIGKDTSIFIRVYDQTISASESKVQSILLQRSDPRVFPLTYDTLGRQYIDYRIAVEQSIPGKFVDTPLLGPHTVPWLLNYMLQNGGGPMSFHHKFLSETRLDYTAAGTSEHMTLCKFFEILMTYDQIDPCKSVACELVGRRIQMVHDRWKHKMPNLSGGGGGEEDTHLLLGTYETRGNVGISPALTEWLGAELGKEAKVQGERRKAREERAATQKEKKTGGG